MGLAPDIEDLKRRIARGDEEISALKGLIFKLSQQGGDVRHAMSRLAGLERIQSTRIDMLFAVAPHEVPPRGKAET